MLKIKKEIDNTALTITLEGRLDASTVSQFEKELKPLDGVTDLTLDFERLEYISSAGLRVLVSAHKTMRKQGTMRVVHVGEAVMEVFEITGFSDVLTIE